MQAFEIAILAIAATIVAVSAGIAGRRQGAVGCWAWSWVLLILAGILLQHGSGWLPARAAGAVIAVLFPGLQLAGALEYVGRAVPRWLVPAFLGIAALRLAVAVAGFESHSHLVTAPFEIAALAAAGRVIYRWGGERGMSPVDWLLVSGFAVIAIAEASDAVLDVTSGLPGVSWTVWLGIGIPVGGCQILAIFVRMQKRLEESLQEREAALQALEGSRQRFRAIAEHAHDLILEADRDLRILYANPRFCEVLGYAPEEALGRELRDFVWDPSSFPTRDDLVDGRDLSPAPLMARCRDGSPRWLESSARVYERGGERRIVVVARDVSERLRLDEQTRKSQKLESLGLMAGGIAHDFNNLLTGIVGNADVALDTMPDRDPARTAVETVVEAAEHAAQLTRQLQSYAGGAPFQVRPVDVSEEIRARAELLNTSVHDNVRLELDLEEGLPAVDADPVQLVQAVLNLAINGAEACGPSPGRVRIATGRRHLEAPLPVTATGSLEAGDHVFIEVTDTGQGIEEAIRDRVFDPFFTTKRTGRGLGLAVVHGVVRTLRAAITLDSSERGSRCRIWIPVSSGSEGASPGRPAPGRLGAPARVLVCDDDRSVLQVVRSVLEARGFAVHTAEDGGAAEKIMLERGPEIGLVLLDAVMPGENVEIVLDRIRARRADVPVLLMSGYTESEAMQRFSSSGELAGFLPKPFRAAVLEEAVNAALARGATTRSAGPRPDPATPPAAPAPRRQ